MNLTPDQTTLLVIILVIAAIALVAAIAARRRRVARGSLSRPRDGRSLPPATLADRVRPGLAPGAGASGRGRLSLVTLPPAEAVRFGQAWNGIQAQFVDNPREAVVRADLLVRELMLKRGFPMSEFEQRATDLAADHPALVANFRAAQTIAARGARGEVDTEELRKAVVHYRALFEELLGVARGSSLPEPVRG